MFLYIKKKSMFEVDVNDYEEDLKLSPEVKLGSFFHIDSVMLS